MGISEPVGRFEQTIIVSRERERGRKRKRERKRKIERKVQREKGSEGLAYFKNLLFSFCSLNLYVQSRGLTLSGLNVTVHVNIKLVSGGADVWQAVSRSLVTRLL